MSLVVRGGRKQFGAGLAWPAPAVCRRWHTVPPRVPFGGRRFHPLAAHGDNDGDSNRLSGRWSERRSSSGRGSPPRAVLAGRRPALPGGDAPQGSPQPEERKTGTSRSPRREPHSATREPRRTSLDERRDPFAEVLRAERCDHLRIGHPDRRLEIGELVGPALPLHDAKGARRARRGELARVVVHRRQQRVVPHDALLPTVYDYARQLATTCSPRSLRIMKRQLWADQFADLEASIRVADAEMIASFGSEDFREGVASFVERRPPRFTGR